jgi:N-acetylglucosaminyldiphosphoundecaprenol N-acetyl-beta-D-mannosaminyltransferase
MFEEDENQCRELIRRINEHNTSMLIMGVGAPKSEIWVDTYRASLPPCWALCVGQAPKIACGVTKRAPILVRRLNGEWLWRICPGAEAPVVALPARLSVVSSGSC